MKVLDALKEVFREESTDSGSAKEIENLLAESKSAINAYEKKLLFSKKTAGFGSGLKVEKVEKGQVEKVVKTKEQDDLER